MLEATVFFAAGVAIEPWRVIAGAGWRRHGQRQRIAAFREGVEAAGGFGDLFGIALAGFRLRGFFHGGHHLAAENLVVADDPVIDLLLRRRRTGGCRLAIEGLLGRGLGRLLGGRDDRSRIG